MIRAILRSVWNRRKDFRFALLFVAACSADPGPPADDLVAGLPRLRIEGKAPGSLEDWPCLIVTGPGEPEMRLGYEPEDGGPRVRPLRPDSILPWPAAAERPEGSPSKLDAVTGRRSVRPAAVLCAPADESFDEAIWRVVGERERSSVPRVYLAGRDEDGRLAALPLFVIPAPMESGIVRLGQALQAQDVLKTPGGRGSFELRIVRSGDTVEYEWGPWSPTWPRPSFTAGSAVLTDAEVRAGGEGPLLPELARMLEGRFQSLPSPRAVVLIVASESALVIDVLRAVECARGDPDVSFWPEYEVWPIHDRRPELPIALPLPPKGTVLTGYDIFEQHPIEITRDGTVAWRPTLESALDHDRRSRMPILVVADRRAPWNAIRTLMLAARKRNRSISLVFARVAPGIPDSGAFAIPDDGPDAVPFTAPPDATAEEVYRRLVHLVNGGAKAIRFE